MPNGCTCLLFHFDEGPPDPIAVGCRDDRSPARANNRQTASIIGGKAAAVILLGGAGIGGAERQQLTATATLLQSEQVSLRSRTLPASGRRLKSASLFSSLRILKHN